MEDKRIVALYIRRTQLPLATKLMNQASGYSEGSMIPTFESRVIEIISDKVNYDECIIILEVKGHYPYIVNEWKKKLIVSSYPIHERPMGTGEYEEHLDI